ncbi:hypothetical protein D6C84_09300 [Aureobasidium pullulans]|uniref:Uncharacterized protein n=1 Tax=Aureobasidium pullulans TaxID=5580 RepID=A0A4S9X7Z1_AURPU|nr:hypothetical protein D6C84_09300 [Aureobasidium pullulans]
MATRINSLESCASSPVTSPSDQSRRSSTPEPAIPTYRGLSPQTKSLAKQVFNPENDFQTDSSSTYDGGLDWLMNMISHTEKLDTTELRRGSFAENVKAAHAIIAAFPKPQENVAEAPADCRLNITPKAHSNLKKEEAILDLHCRLSYVVKIDYGNDKIAYEALVIDYDDKPMQLETEDDRMFYWSNVEGTTVGYCLTLELIRDFPEQWSAHETPPAAELFEHWKEHVLPLTKR